MVRPSVIVLIVSTTTRLPHAIDIMNLAEKFNVSCHNPLNMGYKEKCDELLEGYLPTVQAWLREKLGCLTIEVIQNDVLMTHALVLVYQLLPSAVRMIVREERFVVFCLSHRDRLIEQYSRPDSPSLLPEEFLQGDVP